MRMRQVRMAVAMVLLLLLTKGHGTDHLGRWWRVVRQAPRPSRPVMDHFGRLWQRLVLMMLVLVLMRMVISLVLGVVVLVLMLL